MARIYDLYIACGVILLNVLFTEAGPMCYSCSHVAHPRDCARVVQCEDGESCHAVAFAQPDGNYYYNVGCLRQASCPSSSLIGRRDLAICDRCCTGAYCNRELCDGPPPTEHGPRCLHCETVEHPSQCGEVTECAKGQVCFTREKYVFGERRYQLGCAMPVCAPLGKKRDISERQAGQCEKCCSGENCNRDLCGNTGSPLTHAPATLPKYTPTTTTARPVTQAPRVTTHASVVTTQKYQLNHCYYHGKTYGQGESWVEGCDYNCTCHDAANGRYTCQDICPTYTNVPGYCTMEKPAGQCCSHPVCHGTNFTTVTNFTSTTLINECIYQGHRYKQAETWDDGCKWECECVDASRGYYKCHSKCFTWNLPEKCHLVEPVAGKCCPTPTCPAGYVIQYPPGYVAV